MEPECKVMFISFRILCINTVGLDENIFAKLTYPGRELTQLAEFQVVRSEIHGGKNIVEALNQCKKLKI